MPDFAALKDELTARGFGYLDESRKSRFVNQGYTDLCEEAPWPFLETTTSGAAPLSVSDVREVITVTNSDRELEGRDRRWITDENPLLDQTGVGTYWWRDGNNLRVWPVDVQSITVVYLRVPPALERSEDVPIVPERYHHLIVEYAVIRALRDRMNFDDAQAVWTALQTDLQRMRDTLLDQAQWFQRLTDIGAA
jgi:hypothetical protein